jgi:hypothetical protein
VKDQLEIVGRISHEGMSFLTKTLPSLAKAIDKALATGTTLQAPAFGRKKGSKLPRFLGWLIGMVFSSDGLERANACPVALGYIRQLLLLFYKLQMPYTETQIGKVITDFVSVDRELTCSPVISEPGKVSILQKAALLISRVLCDCSPRDIKPRNGPGSVATGERLDQKSYFRRYYKSCEGLYPLDEYYYLNSSHLECCLTPEGLKFRDSWGRQYPIEFLESGTAKVVLVPKDSRGPRLISMEPLEIQWLQQGQMERLVSHVESNWLTRGHVNFTDQTINRRLALGASMFGVWGREDSLRDLWLGLPTCSRPGRYSSEYEGDFDLVTIDMKEASDRVSLHLVQALFPSNWVEALEATRSTHTRLPSGEVIALNKFAPMGSAVCFPVEALIFWAIAVAAIMSTHPYPSLAQAKKRVWVYGDDIVLHTEDYGVVRAAYELVQLKLNEHKCCVAGSFRESCGMDAYKGVPVTPLRISKCIDRHWPGSTLAAYVAYSNAMEQRGFYECAHELEQLVQRDVAVPYTSRDNGHIQFVRPNADVRTLNRNRGVRTRFNRDLHTYETYGPTPRASISQDHNVTFETYFVRSLDMLSRGNSPQQPLEISFTDFTRGRLTADQHPVPRRVSPKRGWKQCTL